MNGYEPDAPPAPAELDEADLLAVSGGLNPQPLPPRIDPKA